MNDFSAKLKKLRIAAGYTQAEAGALLGVSASAIGMYEQGRREPDLETTQRICELYGVTPNYLVNDSNEDAPSEIGDMICNLREQMRHSEGVMFNGVPINEEDTEKIFDAMMLAAQLIMKQRSEEEQRECITQSKEPLQN